MDKLMEVDRGKKFIPGTSIAEMIIRGTITYWFYFLYTRFFRRSAGQFNISDVLLINLIANGSQNAAASTYESITKGAYCTIPA